MKFSKRTVWIVSIPAILLLTYGFYEWLQNRYAHKNLNLKNTEGSVQLIMNDLCQPEVAQYCPKTWGMETYSCIKAIDPKFLSQKCLSTFK